MRDFPQNRRAGAALFSPITRSNIWGLRMIRLRPPQPRYAAPRAENAAQLRINSPIPQSASQIKINDFSADFSAQKDRFRGRRKWQDGDFSCIG